MFALKEKKIRYMWHFNVTLLMLQVLFCDQSYSCRSAEYEIHGQCCPMCAPGTRVYKHCTEYTSTSCVPCTKESFIDQPNGLLNCRACTVCDPVRSGLKTECTASSDAVCGPSAQHHRPLCKPGTHVYKHFREYPNTPCVQCAQNTFVDQPNSLPECFPCTVCDPDRLGLKTYRECTATSDTVCGPLDQYYCTKMDYKGCKFAQKHTICRPGQFIIENGTTSTNTKCGDCPDKTFSNKSSSTSCKQLTDCQSLGLQEMTAGTNTWDSECETRPSHGLIVAVLLSVLLVTLSLSCIILILRRRKRNMSHLKSCETSTTEQQQDVRHIAVADEEVICASTHKDAHTHCPSAPLP